jgi:hypothetical protein
VGSRLLQQVAVNSRLLILVQMGRAAARPTQPLQQFETIIMNIALSFSALKIQPTAANAPQQI